MKYIKEFKLYEGIEDQLKKYGLELIDGLIYDNNTNKKIKILDYNNEKTTDLIIKLYECGFRAIATTVFKNDNFLFENKPLLCAVIDENEYWIGIKFEGGIKIISYNIILIYLDKLKKVNVKDYIGLSSMNTNYIDYIKSINDNTKFSNVAVNDGLITFKSWGWSIKLKHNINTEENRVYISNILKYNLQTVLTFDIFLGLEKKEFDNQMDTLLNSIIISYKRELQSFSFNYTLNKSFIMNQIDGIIKDSGFFNSLSDKLKQYIIDLLIANNKHNIFAFYQVLKNKELLNNSKYDNFIINELIKDDELFHLVKDKLNIKMINKYLELINNNDSLI